jgi:hypothetical protein
MANPNRAQGDYVEDPDDWPLNIVPRYPDGPLYLTRDGRRAWVVVSLMRDGQSVGWIGKVAKVDLLVEWGLDGKHVGGNRALDLVEAVVPSKP